MLRTQVRALSVASKALPTVTRTATRGFASVRRSSPPQMARAFAVPMTRSFHATSFASEVVSVKVPQMAESITEGTLKQFNKQVGDFIKADEELASIETDKIDVSVNAPQSGKIVELLVEEDATVEVGQEIAKIEPGEDDGSSGGSSAPAAEAPKEEAKKEESKPEPKKEETKAAAPKEEAKPAAPKPAAPKKEESAQQAESNALSRKETRVKMSRMRQTIATRLKASQNAAASLTTFNEIDMSSIMEFRKLYKDGVLKNEGVKLGFMSAFARASVLALREIPEANASIEDDTIVYRDYVDLSVAVATPKGLVTPVVRNAESMGLVDIERAIADLGRKARDGKLTIEDMAGGSFTISNGGVFGSLYGTPIINLPQCAVLGMHSIKEKPVVVNGQIVIRPIMVVALTYDHRLLDGREAVTFLVRVKEYLEDPRRMLLPSPV
ncbi:dihydrolipoamide succinyltransferase [Cutaneotrichosporon oleaginosum]|uniref:dihydrolipoyllysine-residue succinyltransferase n=1 Tax=Cutaneotrichosporon oleaginosum TaxID=879819 RepID=A0A0J1B6G1_9TREE|nr:dihydrolipoamide succinyltransferase [Cutaneotrichosporon oleaginosum]KLT43319.1 dihydrolipoamide succinyltransferase [Cutaneotrichosporon oleaginosum]TXT14419.1 hypothetical protein COLE_00612 [Cutaneotrichosporon oleaginosum]